MTQAVDEAVVGLADEQLRGEVAGLRSQVGQCLDRLQHEVAEARWARRQAVDAFRGMTAIMQTLIGVLEEGPNPDQLAVHIEILDPNYRLEVNIGDLTSIGFSDLSELDLAPSDHGCNRPGCAVCAVGIRLDES